MALSEKEQLRQQWLASFQKASQADSWGQVVEAQEQYQIMAGSIAAKQGQAYVSSSEKDTMHRIVLCLSARVTALKSLKDTITSADMKRLEPVFEALFTGAESRAGDFPIEAFKFQNAQPVKPSTEGEIICADRDEAYSDWHHAEAALSSVRGTVVSIRLEKVGLKDAQDYIDPTVTLLVADPRQNILDRHETPVASERRATHVIFNHQMYLNISLEDMQRSSAAIFLEFKHYKPKKKKVSTRCWCFLELQELKRDEEIVLEIYHKPTDLKKKKLKLHSEKPLYMHLYASFIRP